jgi:Ca2+-binding EF-hand superfamily protein
VFDALDTNEDGTVSLEELTASLQPQQPPAPPVSTQQASEQLFSTLDADSDGSISAEELTSALSATSNGSTNTTDKTSQELSRMVAALTERYDTDGSKPVGKYLDTAA